MNVSDPRYSETYARKYEELRNKDYPAYDAAVAANAYARSLRADACRSLTGKVSPTCPGCDYCLNDEPFWS